MLRRDPSRRAVGVFLAVTIAAYVLAMIVWYGPLLSESPNLTVAVEDAPGPLHLNESGTVSIVTITHTGGEPVEYDDLTVFVGDRREPLEFSARTHWTFVEGEFRFGLQLEGERVDQTGAEAFEPGDTLTFVKTRGTADDVDSLDLYVSVVNTARDVTIEETTVRAE